MRTYSELLTRQNLAESPELSELTAQINQDLKSRRHKRLLQRLANNLITALRIPEGDHLTFILGYGNATSNYQAVYYWVADQFENSGWSSRGDNDALFIQLKEALHHHLSYAMTDYDTQGGI